MASVKDTVEDRRQDKMSQDMAHVTDSLRAVSQYCRSCYSKSSQGAEWRNARGRVASNRFKRGGVLEMLL